MWLGAAGNAPAENTVTLYSVEEQEEKTIPSLFEQEEQEEVQGPAHFWAGPWETVDKVERREGAVWRGNRQGSPSASSEADQPARRRSKVGKIVRFSPLLLSLA